jgi:hypothetical protein
MKILEHTRPKCYEIPAYAIALAWWRAGQKVKVAAK